MPKPPRDILEQLSNKLTLWIGSPASIVLHTIFFLGIFGLRYFSIQTEEILLILTTVVSLEAIYLAIFIQMTVNRNTQSLEGVEEDIEELSEEVEDIGEDIEELSEDVGEISEDVEEISDDVDRIQEEDEREAREDLLTRTTIESIENSLKKFAEEIENLKQSIRK